ncbi:MAG: ABC transporter permease [Sulfolobales archaeon]|nr:ABC transporter permease [Sulfolobales archaeon]MCX8199274.1 ABC transporter permease [Sulfolobales archaeon]MDW8170412.1 ABC transporter permease [Desulfurococcaceae archaeon]
MSDLSTLLWKELLDLSRDYKAILTTVLLPLILLPILGLVGIVLVSQQPATVALIDEDHCESTNSMLNITISSRRVAEILYEELSKKGFKVIESNDTSVVDDPLVDLVVIIPRGFATNATSLSSTASVLVIKRANVQASAMAEQAAREVISWLSYSLARVKIDALSKYAGVEASSEAILSPIVTQQEVVTIVGEKAGVEEELKGLLARFLVLALGIVVTPATSFIIDGIIGERERKTIEMLISLPIPLSKILYSKVLAATIVGIIATISDVVGFLTYIYLTLLVYGVQLMLFIDPLLLVIHAFTSFLTILTSVAMALPFITRTRGIRSASNIAGIVTIIATIIFFTGFIVDYYKLPMNVKTPLYLIPFTHSVLAIQLYVIGYRFESLLHTLILLALSAILLLISIRTLDSEKILVAPPS